MTPGPLTRQRRALRLLLVEDQADDADLTRRAIARIGLPVEMEVARDGAEALEVLARQIEAGGGPDLVLLDLNLPKVDGWEVLARMKADGAMGRIPVVILSTSGNPEHVQSAYAANAAAYLQKPGEFQELVAQMRAVVEMWGNQALLAGRV